MISFFLRISIGILFLSAHTTVTAETKAQNKQARVWGKIVKVDKKIHGFEYFVTYYEGDKLMAYPFKKNEKTKISIEQLVDKVASISGEIKTHAIQYDGGQKLILYFVPHQMKPLNLYKISENPKSDSESSALEQSLIAGQSATNNRVPKQGGIEISDKAANTIIAVSGAALLGSIVSDILKKKKK